MTTIQVTPADINIVLQCILLSCGESNDAATKAMLSNLYNRISQQTQT